MAGEKVESISSRGVGGCFRPSVPSLSSFQSEGSTSSVDRVPSCGNGPFSGLAICVTGLSKEARRHVMEVTERLGGKYCASLHLECTHLVVQSFSGCKLQHAMKHGLRNGLFVVTLGWWIDSVRRNVRISESPYTVHSAAKMGNQLEDRVINSTGPHDSCVPIGWKQTLKQCEEIGGQKLLHSEGTFEVNKQSHLLGQSIYIDLDVSAEIRNKVVDVAIREGATLVDQWFVGCSASYVVCEGSSVQRYLGHSDNIVSPIWVLKTSKERSMQRFVGLSADLARQVGMMLENVQHVPAQKETYKDKLDVHVHPCRRHRVSQAERLQIVNRAKCGIRNRRNRQVRSCEVPLRPINSSTLLDSICWSISEPTSTAAVYADSFLSKNDSQIHKQMLSKQQEGMESEVSFSNSLRPLTESEKNELIFKSHFLTLLFPVDRFAEMGPSSRTYFSNTGFTCLQLLDFIYEFYQESMSDHEVEAAIHTDSRHAEQLRSVYCSETTERVMYKRIEFIGSRKSVEMLKRVSGDNNGNVYELLIRA